MVHYPSMRLLICCSLHTDFKVNWTSVKDLVAIVNDPSVTSVMLDLMGSSGFMRPLLANCPDLPKKVLNSSFPIPLMCGVLAELTPQTLKVYRNLWLADICFPGFPTSEAHCLIHLGATPSKTSVLTCVCVCVCVCVRFLHLQIPGRDPRAGMNCIYHKPREMLDLAKWNSAPLLFVSNNSTNNILRFEDDVELVNELKLNGECSCDGNCSICSPVLCGEIHKCAPMLEGQVFSGII